METLDDDAPISPEVPQSPDPRLLGPIYRAIRTRSPIDLPLPSPINPPTDSPISSPADAPDSVALPDPQLVQRIRAACDAALNLTSPPIQRARGAFDVPGYRPIRKIGHGGQGVVWEAIRERTGERVAVKFLSPDRADEPEQARLRREAEVLRGIQHRNILPFVDMGELPDRGPYLVTQFIDGEPFDTLFDPRDPSWRAVRSMMSGATDLPVARKRLIDPLRAFAIVCRAVQAAHEAGVVHGDLKPSNIRLNRNDEPVVLDFGLCHESTRIDPDDERSILRARDLICTLPWASPEQAEGKPPTPASDVYSLGVLLYQLLTAGRFPYKVAGNIGEVIRQITTARPAPLSSAPESTGRAGMRIAVDPALEAIVMKALEKAPAQRHASAGALADAIEQFRAGERTAPGRRRAIGIVLALLLIVAASIGAWSVFRPDLQSDWTTRPRPGEWVDPATEAIFVRIPPGSFVMGRGSPSRDNPPREVTFEQVFWIQKTEVSQREYELVMGQNPSKYVSSDLPVERVSYRDAVAYCEKLSAMTGRRYRLPTEEEWEYAARAGTQTTFPWGNDALLAIQFANFADQSTEFDRAADRMRYNDGHPYTAPVYSFRENAWGVMNMLGNVWEWTAGPYRVVLSDPSTAIADFAALRGRSWHDVPQDDTVTARNAQPIDARFTTTGFRIVVELPDLPPATRP